MKFEGKGNVITLFTAYVEQFGTGSRTKVSSQSNLRNLVYIIGGMQSNYHGKIYCFGNTCNTDCTLMILQTTNAIRRNFINDRLEKYPETNAIKTMLQLITNDNVGEAKLRWWLEVLKKPLPTTRNFIDMLGTLIFFKLS